MTLKRRAVKGVAWTFIERLSSRSIMFLVLIVLARLLTPEEFGIAALGAVLVFLPQVLLYAGFASALIQKKDLEAEYLDTAFWTILGVAAIIALALLALAPFAATFFDNAELAPVIRWLSPIIVISGLVTCHESLFRRELNFRPLAVRTILSSVAGGVIGIGMAYTGMGVYSLVGQRLAGATAMALVLWWSSGWRPRAHFHTSHSAQLFRFGVHMFGSGFLRFVTNGISIPILTYHLGPAAAGFYSLAQRIRGALGSVTSGMTARIAFPAFSEIQDQPERLLKAFYSVSRLSTVLSFPAYAGLAMIAPEAVEVLFGEKWNSAVPVIQALALGGIIESLQSANASLIVAKGRPQWVLQNQVVHTAFALAGIFVAVRWGPAAVALAYSLSAYLLFPFQLRFVRRLIPVTARGYITSIHGPLLASIFMVACLLGSRIALAGMVPAAPFLIGSILLGALVYGGALWVADRHLPSELVDMLRSLQTAPELPDR